jgi:hypothetical protein
VSPADVSSTASLPLSAPTLSSTSVRSVAAPVRAAVGERAEFDVRLPVAEHVECGGDAKPQRPLTPPPSGRNLRDPKFDALFEREPPEEVSELLDAAKFQVHVQLRMAERLDSKVRGLIGLTAVFAGAVQAFALREDIINELAQGSKWALGLAAAASALLLASRFC